MMTVIWIRVCAFTIGEDTAVIETSETTMMRITKVQMSVNNNKIRRKY